MATEHDNDQFESAEAGSAEGGGPRTLEDMAWALERLQQRRLQEQEEAKLLLEHSLAKMREQVAQLEQDRIDLANEVRRLEQKLAEQHIQTENRVDAIHRDYTAQIENLMALLGGEGVVDD